jgi:hypothetical protein
MLVHHPGEPPVEAPVTQDQYRAQKAAELRELLAKAVEQETELVAETGETTTQWFERTGPAHVRAVLGARPGAKAAAMRLPARTRARRRGAGRPRAAATRSSVRSGDSGDDDPDPEPPVADPWRWASPSSWRTLQARWSR